MKPEEVLTLIKSRRTIYPPNYSDQEITTAELEQIIEAAIWAPNHGRTEPWRFHIFQGEKKNTLGNFLAEEYKKQFTGDAFNPRKFENASTWPGMTPCIIVVTMHKGDNTKIPVIEEERACAAAIQNMLLMARSLNIGSYWSTGKLAYSHAMHSFLKLREEDQVIGLIYLGHIKNEGKEGRRSPKEDFIL